MYPKIEEINWEDPEIYDKLALALPFFREMLKKIETEIEKYLKKEGNIKVLEPCAGTGLLTERIAKQNGVELIVSNDINRGLYEIAKKRLNEFKNTKMVLCDAVDYYKGPERFDVIAMNLAYHHIEDSKKRKFLENCYKQLRPGGKIIVGDVFLPEYKNDKERDVALIDFHSYRAKVFSRIVKGFIELNEKKIRASRINVLVETTALVDGLSRNGEYKTSKSVLRNFLADIGFKNIEDKLVVPKSSKKFDPERVGEWIITAEK